MLTALHWLDHTGVFSGVLVMWVGAASPIAAITWLAHHAAERRHREHVAAINRLTAATLAPPPKE